MPANDTKLVVRLPQADKRRIKRLAATQGLTLGQAVLQAFEAWASQLQSGGAPPPDPRPGGRTHTAYEKPTQPKRGPQGSAQEQRANRSTSSGQAPGHQTTPRQGGRRPDEAPSLAPGRDRVPNRQAPSLDWLHRVAQLDLNWSKCPAAEKVHEKTGNVWVARGTHVPVTAVLDAVAEGESLAEIAAVYGITLQQLITILQFATEGATARSAK
jgi:hypothetical protein